MVSHDYYDWFFVIEKPFNLTTEERAIIYRPRQRNRPLSQRTRGATNTSPRSRASTSEQPTTSHATSPPMWPQNFSHSMHSSFQPGSNPSEGFSRHTCQTPMLNLHGQSHLEPRLSNKRPCNHPMLNLRRQPHL
ncbi:hypothetical protein V6N13_126775 [Hibiscus sabdariffa]